MNRLAKSGRVGIDIIETGRFKELLKTSKTHQLKKIFTESEIVYCRNFQNPAMHLAGHFAAKEAASKVLGAYKIPVTNLEIHHDKKGAPEVWSNLNNRRKKLKIKISISHIKSLAIAVAIS